MKKTKWLIAFLLIIAVVCGFCSCLNVSSTTVKIDLPKLSPATVVEVVDKKIDLYKIADGNMIENTSLDSISNVVYSLKYPSYIYSVKKATGNTLVNNELKIMSSNNQVTLNNFYNAADMKLSPNGETLAYRTYSKDDINSAEGMKLYDIKDSKQIAINTKVLISGNVYNWLSKDEILYYGLIPDKQGSSKIYKYNTQTKSEEIYVDKLSGYVTYFTAVGNDVLFLQKNGDTSSLTLYEKSSGGYISIDDKIDDIYKTVVNTKTSEVLILANSKSENKTKLYSYSLKDHTLKSVTYDFPQFINKTSSIASDANGNVYFSGSDTADGQNNSDIYMYKASDGSINLISDHEGSFFLIGSE
jgi:hypothetical protein